MKRLFSPYLQFSNRQCPLPLKLLVLFAALSFISGCGFASPALTLTPQANAQVAAAPTSLSWASVTIGNTGAQQTATFTNSGSASVTISSIGISGTDSGDFLVMSQTCASTLGAGASCTVNVVFRPAATGARTATLSFSSSGSNQQVSLSGTGAAASSPTSGTTSSTASASPSSISWASVAIGNTGAGKAATLTNTGTASISISSIGTTGTNAGDFVILSKTCGATLAASASCTATVGFRPTATGTRTATLNFTDSAGMQQVALSGLGTSGTSGSVTASPTSLSFSSTNIGSTSAAQTITVKNGTSGPVTLSGAGITGTDATDFSYTTTCGSSLAASASCTASVSFKPATTGSLTASWTIKSSSSSTALMVALSGTGTTTSTGGTATASPTSLTWGTVQFGNTGAAKTVTLTNTGSNAINFTGITFSGSDPNDFPTTTTCGSSLAASASCTASVSFKPTAAGTRTATLNLNDSASNSPQTVALSGTATSNSSGSVTTSPSTLNFSSVNVGSSSGVMTATLSNSTASSISISAIGISGTNAGDYTIQSKGCGSSLGSSSSCSVTVIFKPTAAGNRTATLNFTDSASNSPQGVLLTGSGLSGSGGTASVSPTSVNFGSFPQGTSSGIVLVTLKNTGTTFLSAPTIKFTGADPSDFHEPTQSCGSGLNPSATCTISLTFDPTAIGTRTATLTLTDAASNSPQTVALTGTGTAAPTTTLTISPSSLNWGAQTVGATAATKTFTLTAGCVTAGCSGSLTFSSPISGSNQFKLGADPGDFTVSGTNCSSSLNVGSSCTVSVAFKPAAIGNRLALFSVADNGSASPQTAAVSGDGAYSTAQTADLTVDFGSRSGSQVVIPKNILGSEYLESLPSNPNRTTVFQGGFTTARYRTQLQLIFPSSANAPSWGLLNSDMTKLQAEGVTKVIMEVENTPTFLQPNPLICSTAPYTSQPTNPTTWGQLVTQVAHHMDVTFPGLATYYEIWNEPDTAALCDSVKGESSTNKESDYHKIFAAAAPQIQAQGKADGVTLQTGGPATAGPAFLSLLTDSTTAPYVDFYSYHYYVGSNVTINDGMTWNGANGTPSLLNLTTSTSVGIMPRYLQAAKAVAASTLTPNKGNTPIFYDEYNDDWDFVNDCCRNNPTYSPLFNSIAVEQVFNSVYNGAREVPANMIYFAAAQPTFCILAIIDSAMDCSKATTQAEAQPYPQWYTYKMLFAPSYLDLQDGGHMAASITPTSTFTSAGLFATAFYTSTADSVVIINPTVTSYKQVTLQINNSGLSSPTAAMYALNASCANVTPASCTFAPGSYLSTWPATTISASGGTQVTFDLPPYSVLAVQVK